jgi:hypothetical protein
MNIDFGMITASGYDGCLLAFWQRVYDNWKRHRAFIARLNRSIDVPLFESIDRLAPIVTWRNRFLPMWSARRWRSVT